MANTFRKRQGAQQGQDRSRFSSVLRGIGWFAEHGQTQKALQDADRLLADPGLGRHERARVLALVGDSEARRGRFEDAVAYYTRSATLTLDHDRLWVRPLIGQVEVLLKAVRIREARMIARHACEVAERKFAAFDARVREGVRVRREGGVVVIEGRPVRPGVVASRMGFLFLKEGELDAAQEFFERARKVNKRGACRARLGLAEVALAQGDAKRALELAEEAIRVGRYRAKTLGAWSVVIRARARLGGGRISERLLNGLWKAEPSVRARAIRLIVSELRRTGMKQWENVAQDWLRREGDAFPVAATELKKMMLASWKAVPGHAAEKRIAARQVLGAPGLGPREWVAAAREYARWSLWEKKNPRVDTLVAIGVKRYGVEWRGKIRHGLALACMMAQRHDLARKLLESNAAESAPQDEDRSRALWALARMESVLGEHERAANLYRAVYESPYVPVRFRAQARLLCLREMLQMGERRAPHVLREELNALLIAERDPETRMDMARQIRVHVPALREWSKSVFGEAAKEALAEFERAKIPGDAAGILLKVARRQVYDFDGAAEVVEFWEKLPQEKKDWLWSPDRRFWQYLGCVALAYVRLGEEGRLRLFAGAWLQDAATPAEGWAEIGVRIAAWLVERRATFGEGMELFEEILRRVPRHPLTALGWYWKALVAHKEGHRQSCVRCCRALRESQGTRPGLLSEWQLDARALLLMAGLDEKVAAADAVNYSADFLRTQKSELLRDLEKIP